MMNVGIEDIKRALQDKKIYTFKAGSLKKNDNGKVCFVIPLNPEKSDFKEKFNNSSLYSQVNFNGNYELVFQWDGKQDLGFDFFLSSGMKFFLDGKKQKEFYDNPEKCANIIRDAFGNSDVQDPVAEKIAELYVFLQLLENNMKPEFGGFSSKSSIDIECASFDVEVKSTTLHHDWKFHSTCDQLNVRSERPLYLFFCRFEKTEINDQALSIQTLCNILLKKRVDVSKIKNLPTNTSDKERMYRLKDAKVFKIDENFKCPEMPSSTKGISLISFELRLDPAVLSATSLEDFLKNASEMA